MLRLTKAVALPLPGPPRSPILILLWMVWCIIAFPTIPRAVARTSTFALNNATLPFVLALANKGYRKALTDDPHLRNGLNVYRGKLTHEAVARDLGLVYMPALELLADR